MEHQRPSRSGCSERYAEVISTTPGATRFSGALHLIPLQGERHELERAICNSCDSDRRGVDPGHPGGPVDPTRFKWSAGSRTNPVDAANPDHLSLGNPGFGSRNVSRTDPDTHGHQRSQPIVDPSCADRNDCRAHTHGYRDGRVEHNDPVTECHGDAGAEPTQTPADAPVAVVKLDPLSIRQGPSTDAALITRARSGDIFSVLGRSADDAWLKVCCVDEAPAWLAAEFVEVSVPVTSLPVVEP